jgi:N-acetyl-gamma-glutamyl-phosphate reductase
MLVMRHPALELAFATANAQRGQTLRTAGQDLTFIATEDAPLDKVDLVFSALPHGASIDWVKRARAAGAKVVDLSSDLRPGNNGQLDGAGEIPYGLTELNREAVANANVVANPGCYPTAILLAVAPLVRSGLLESGSTIPVTAASGVTGAGFTPRPDLLFAEISEDYRAYAIGNDHRHLREMNAVLKEQGSDNDLVFTPHLLPVARGILATIVVRLKNEIENPLSIWSDAFAGEPFIQVSESTPGTSRCREDKQCEDLSGESSEYHHTDVDHHIGNRQSDERCCRPGPSERQSHARTERADGTAGVDESHKARRPRSV